MKRGSAITIPNFIYSHISLFYKYLSICSFQSLSENTKRADTTFIL